MLRPQSEVLDRFQRHVVSQAKRNLTMKDKRVSNKLYNSIQGDVKENPNSIQILFSMLDYGYFQDRGVKGTRSGRSLSGLKFGSGTGVKGGLTNGIESWVKARQIQFRDRKSGRFLSSKQTANLITRSIWRKGIEPTEFFTKPFEQAFKNLPDELVIAYGLEVNQLFDEIMIQNFNKK